MIVSMMKILQDDCENHTQDMIEDITGSGQWALGTPKQITNGENIPRIINFHLEQQRNLLSQEVWKIDIQISRYI